MTGNVTVIGGGTVSENHLSAARESNRSQLRAVCDLEERRATSVARSYGITAHTDVDKLLAAEDLDVVHMCLPVQTHFSIAAKAIRSGVAVIVEKPVTETLSELDELQNIADEHGVPVTVIHQHQFSPAMREARAIIESGEIGEIHGSDLIYTAFSEPDEINRGEWVFDLRGASSRRGCPI